MAMKECILCPNMCRVDRSRERGICGESWDVRIAWAGLHRGEEPPITGEHGSGMIFFAGCPLHCRYCQNIQISKRNGLGYECSEEELIRIMFSLQSIGACTLNLVTGTHFIPQIAAALEKAGKEGFSLPVVWNSSGYESPEGLSLIDPFIDIYLLDCKTLSSDVASVFCGRKRYADIIIPIMDWIKQRHSTTDLSRMKGTILRHLIFPGTIDATKDFLHLFASRYKESFFLSLMTQFVPPEGEEMPRISEEECEELVFLMEELGIEDGFMQDPDEDDILWIPDFNKDIPFPEMFASPDPEFLSMKHRLLDK